MGIIYGTYIFSLQKTAESKKKVPFFFKHTEDHSMTIKVMTLTVFENFFFNY